jgi:hypothetical protein
MGGARFTSVVGAASFLLAAACGPSDGYPSLAGVGEAAYSAGGAGDSETLATGACSENAETRTCKVIVGIHDGVIDCFKGWQVCEKGMWGPCDGRNRPSDDDAGASHSKAAQAIHR